MQRERGEEQAGDPIVDAVRKYRMEHTRQFNLDLHQICEALRIFESSFGDRVVSVAPERAPAKKTKGWH